ncbi:alpha/beta hydrolase fold domain-containing protein [Paraburkholderia sediminicola]|uniref:flavin-containing monooxygenase n=1 Tax=Paraburkholderia sediminicola TaxID=458836 RepID=UPI0038BB936B
MRTPDSIDRPQATAPLTAIIVGTGFGGIGMGVALRKHGIEDFVILEKASDVGGVWRDNSYPGAACDVPSHLYSFSFEPNPDWSRAFAPQAEIYGYLRHCARKYDLLRHIRFGSEVRQASYDESRSVWVVTLTNGASLEASLFISATGQLSRPALPRIPGMQDFKGRAFHSATWDHDYDLRGKRIAVIGTGASAIQFVPVIAQAVSELKLFQRSPAYILPRPDRAYAGWEKSLFRRMPWTAKLHRAAIYVRYESRAIAFTRFKALMKLAVGVPFRRMLSKQVRDPALRARLVPDYPIGCKRVLLSTEYLSTMDRENVEVVTEGIRSVTANGVETTDGKVHPVDAIIYGTGFAATEFLSPMRIFGRAGTELNSAWRQGAQAYLGLTVPGFPNFFMLYGPNTNLGHNSIVFMLESQIAHVMRCLKLIRRTRSTSIEVNEDRYRRYNVGVQQRLAGSVWNGCKSWYVDATGHNSTNWPGFTVSYRWLTRRSGLHAYSLASSVGQSLGIASATSIAEPRGMVERGQAALLRGVLRTCFRPLIGPPFTAATQRRVVAVLSRLMPGRRGAMRYRAHAANVSVEIVAPKIGETGGAILYLHGGAFCLGSPATHRSITTHLAVGSGMSVWVPEYRLAPEHPHPAALDDALTCYRELLNQGYGPDKIVIAGDSAGGALALSLVIALRDRGERMPAGLLLISPVTDPALAGVTLQTHARLDPMIRRGWLEQGLRWYALPAEAASAGPLRQDLQGLPPMLIQVGSQEVLLSDAVRLAEHAARGGVSCRLEIHAARWHVFHLQSFYLKSAVRALLTLADFARAQVSAVRAAGHGPVTKTAQKEDVMEAAIG